MFTARELMIEIGFFAAASQRAANRPGSGGRLVDREFAAAVCGFGELSVGEAHESIGRGALTGGFFVSGVWNEIKCATHLIDGL